MSIHTQVRMSSTLHVSRQYVWSGLQKRQKKEMKLNEPRRHPLEKRTYCVWMRRAKADCDLTKPRFRFWVEEMANERDGIDVGSGF